MKASQSNFRLGGILALLGFIAIAVNPAVAADGAKRGLTLCALTIVPSVFPFVALSRIVVKTGAMEILSRLFTPISKCFFNVDGVAAGAFLFGITGSYPIGASAVCDLYRCGSLKKKDAERILGFCNNSGVSLLVSVCGVAIFNSVKLGFLLFGVHIITAVLVGIIMRPKEVIYANGEANKPMNFSDALTGSISGAATTCISISGFIVFFCVLISLLDAYGILTILCFKMSHILSLEPSICRAVLCGVFELSTGVSTLMGIGATAQSFSVCSAIVGFGGLSIHAQTASIANGCGLSMRIHFVGKLLHCILSFTFAYLLFTLLLPFLA